MNRVLNKQFGLRVGPTRPLAEGASRNHYTSTSRRLLSVSVKEILASTARHHGVRVSPYAAIRSQQPVVTWRS